jgi:hypothetical protein
LYSFIGVDCVFRGRATLIARLEYQQRGNAAHPTLELSELEKIRGRSSHSTAKHGQKESVQPAKTTKNVNPVGKPEVTVTPIPALHGWRWPETGKSP